MSARTRRTIDNLGYEAYSRYAKDQKQYDERLIKEAGRIPQQTEVAVTSSYFPSEFDLLFQTGLRNLQWAFFAPPPLFSEQKKRLFTFLAVPSLGSTEKKGAQATKIRSRVLEPTGERERPQAQLQEEHDKREQAILTKLFDLLVVIDRILIEINSRRGQYHKG